MWRYSSKISNKIVQIKIEKTIKLKREEQPKTQVKVHSNINRQITSNNSNTFKVMKFQDQALTKQLKNPTKQLQTPPATKITVALTLTIK